MAKQTRTVQAAQHGKMVKHEETFDDNLLPSYQELEKLNQIDSSLIEFVKETTRKEQDFRHKAHLESINAFNNQDKRAFRINITGMILAFLVFVLGMLFSYAILTAGFSTIGTIFAGGTILAACITFINAGQKKVQK